MSSIAQAYSKPFAVKVKLEPVQRRNVYKNDYQPKLAAGSAGNFGILKTPGTKTQIIGY